MKITIKGLEFYTGEQGDRPFRILAHGTVAIGSISIFGVTLAWSKDQGATALAPAARSATGAHVVRWDSKDIFAKEAARQMFDLYLRMGGKLPEEKPKRQFVPFHELELSEDEGLPMRERVRDALEAESERRGVECFTEILEWPEPEADDHEAVEGLHRTLGVDLGIAEEMRRVGL
jgi:hypothetical protein